jgi:hypothetical protein
MFGVFLNINPPPPHRPPLVRGKDILAGGERGWGVKSSEDARHCSVLDICKYFVVKADLRHGKVISRHQ